MGLVAVARSAIPPPAGAGIQLQQPTRISALSAQKLHRIHSGRRGPSLLRELLVSNVRDYAISVERLGYRFLLAPSLLFVDGSFPGRWEGWSSMQGSPSRWALNWTNECD